ncbi:unnamed protein product, partial [Adineta steineri]
INNRTKLDSWLPFLSVLNECETKLLVARNVDALLNTISRTDIKQWCTEHDYELLELEKNKTSETDDEDDDEDGEDDENAHRNLSRCLWYTTFNSNTSYSSMAKYRA